MPTNLPVFTSVGSIDDTTPISILSALSGSVPGLMRMKTLLLLNRSNVVLWLANSAAACVAGGANAFPLEAESAGAGSGGSVAIDCEIVPPGGELYVIAASGSGKTLGVVYGAAL